MSVHSNNHGNAIVLSRYKRDSGQLSINFPSYLLINYHIIVFYWQHLCTGVFISSKSENKNDSTWKHVSIDSLNEYIK